MSLPYENARRTFCAAGVSMSLIWGRVWTCYTRSSGTAAVSRAARWRWAG